MTIALPQSTDITPSGTFHNFWPFRNRKTIICMVEWQKACLDRLWLNEEVHWFFWYTTKIL